MNSLVSWVQKSVVLVCSVVMLMLTPLPAYSEPQAHDRTHRYLQISLDTDTLDIVTTGSDKNFIVTGQVQNVGDTRVNHIEMRLQRAPEVLHSQQLATRLGDAEDNYDTVGPFVPVVEKLSPHESAAFRLTIPLRGMQESLHISRPGVYPILVNVNGTPESHERERLDDLRFYLPVLGVPATGTNTALPAKIDHPTQIKFVIPLADHPRWMPGSLAMDGRVQLIDDELAKELTPQGRLGVLLAGLQRIAQADDQSIELLHQATCIAVDPDLLRTVTAITQDYVTPGPHGGLIAGKGSVVAREWIAQLRDLAAHYCITALPFAHVAFSSLTEIQNPTLEHTALEDAAGYVENVLSTEIHREVTTSYQAAVPQTTIDLLTRNQIHTLIAPRPEGEGEESKELAPGLQVKYFDSAITRLLGQLSSLGEAELEDYHSVPYRQSAIAALLWPTLYRSNPDQFPSTGDAEIVMPPAVWSPNAADFDALFFTAKIAIRAGIATPVRWDESIVKPTKDHSEERTTESGGEEPTVQSLDPPLSSTLLHKAKISVENIKELVTGIVDQPDNPLTAELYERNWYRNLLRVLADSSSSKMADQRLLSYESAWDTATRSVTLVDPGKPYTLFTEEGSLPVVVRNGLPVSVKVQIVAQAPSGVEVFPVDSTVIPAHGSRVLSLPVRVKAPKISPIRIELKMAGGKVYGVPATVLVQSGRYTGLLKKITGAIGAVLLVLMAWRLWSRLRHKSGPRSRQTVDAHQRKMAGLGFKERTLVENKWASSAQKKAPHPQQSLPTTESGQSTARPHEN